MNDNKYSTRTTCIVLISILLVRSFATSRFILIADCIAFVFPGLLIHEDVKGSNSKHRMIFQVRKTTGKYVPPAAAVVMFFVIGITMAYDFSLLMGAVLDSTKMTLVWLIGQPFRILTLVATAVYLFVAESPRYFTLSIAAGVYLIFLCLFTVMLAERAMRYFRALRITQKRRQKDEQRRKLGELDRLKLAAAAQMARKQRRDQAKEKLEEVDQLQDEADLDNILFMRSKDDQKNDYDRWKKDMAPHASRIAM